eukprot:10774637-Alexandrium_andersonii.AAC.1
MAPEGTSDPGAYYLQQAFRIFQDYTGCLLAYSSPDAQVIRLRNGPLPTWASGCSALLFTIPLPTEAGGLRSGLEWNSDFVCAPADSSGGPQADRQSTVYTAHFGDWPN